MEMPATPLSVASFIFPCSPPALLSLIPLPQEGEVFSACVLRTFSPFFCLCSRQGIYPTTIYSPSLSLSRFYHHCSLLLPLLQKNPPSIPYCVKKNEIFEGSLLLLTSFSASTIESLYSVFSSHFLSLMSR